MDILFGETMDSIEIQFQRSYDISVVVDRYREQRQNAALAARFRVEQHFDVHILAANDLSGAHAGRADGRGQRHFSFQRQRRCARSRQIAHPLGFQDANAGPAPARDLSHSLRHHRQGALQAKVFHLDLPLRFDNLCQRERVIAGTCGFLHWLWHGSLTGRFLLAQALVMQRHPYFQFLLLAIVLLQHMRRLQQLLEVLLVKSRFLLLIGHNLFAPVGCRRRLEGPAGN